MRGAPPFASLARSKVSTYDGFVLRIGAGIVHYRFWPEVRATLDALCAQSQLPDVIVVIDNGSADGSAEAIRDAYPDISVIAIGDNRGPIGGMNLALDALLERGVEAILLLTHETLLAPDALEVLGARLEQDDRIGVVGPLLGYLSSRDRVWSAGGEIHPRTWDTDHRVEPRQVSKWEGHPPRTVDWLDGACLLLRSEAVRRAGSLHEDYFMVFDEVDYQLRLKELGWRAECVPAALAWQEPGAQPAYTFTRNRLGFLSRRAPRRMLARELVRVVYYCARDAVHPRRGVARSDVARRLHGTIDFLRSRWGRPPAAPLAPGPREGS